MEEERGWEIRIVDTGDALTVARVYLDPFGEPAVTDLDVLYAESLSSLREMIDDVILALDKPVLSLRNLA